MKLRSKFFGSVVEMSDTEWEVIHTEPAPERWVDVTAECSASQMQAYHEGLAINQYAPGYRLRKVPAMTRADMVFIVERKEPA